jgi:hypothetical protein
VASTTGPAVPLTEAVNVTVRSGWRKSGDQLQVTVATDPSSVVAVVVRRTGLAVDV